MCTLCRELKKARKDGISSQEEAVLNTVTATRKATRLQSETKNGNGNSVDSRNTCMKRSIPIRRVVECLRCAKNEKSYLVSGPTFDFF